jgi:hypothetical protein
MLIQYSWRLEVKPSAIHWFKISYKISHYKRPRTLCLFSFRAASNFTFFFVSLKNNVELGDQHLWKETRCICGFMASSHKKILNWIYCRCHFEVSQSLFCRTCWKAPKSWVGMPELWYTVLHMFRKLLFWAGNQGNHQNVFSSLLTKKLWLIFMGMKQKKKFQKKFQKIPPILNILLKNFRVSRGWFPKFVNGINIINLRFMP